MALLHDKLVDVTDADRSSGCVIVKDGFGLIVQNLLSCIVTEYVPATSPVKSSLFTCPPGTTPLPLAAHV